MRPDTEFVITAMSSAEDGREWRLPDLPALIGRSPENAVVLAYDSRVSRRHAELLLIQGRVFLRDLGSRNGTFVGAKRINTPTPIDDGTLFRVGHTWLRFSCVNP